MNEPIKRIEELEQWQRQVNKDIAEIHQNETFLVGLVKEINRDVKLIGLRVSGIEHQLTDLSGEVSLTANKFEQRFNALESKLDQILSRLPKQEE